MSRKNGVSKRIRRLKSGAVRYDVRWRETIAAKRKELSETFTSMSDADKFEQVCRARIGAAREYSSVMDEVVKPEAKCLDLLEEFVKTREEEGNGRSRYPRNVRFQLTRVFTLCGWQVTSDIPKNAFACITKALGTKRTHRVKTAQTYLATFINWAQDRYKFTDGIVRQKHIVHKTSKYVIWSDEEKDLIIQALTAPLAVVPEQGSRRALRRARVAATKAYLVRLALFPIIWLELYWAPRPNEASLLRVRDWDSRNRTLRFPSEITKSKTERSFVVDRTTALMINGLVQGRRQDDYIYRNSRCKRWTTANQTKHFSRVLRSLGLRGSLYSCRHYAATTLLEQMPGEMAKVMRITGHATMAQLQAYILEKEYRRKSVPDAYEAQYEVLFRQHSQMAGFIAEACGQSATDIASEVNEAREVEMKEVRAEAIRTEQLPPPDLAG